MNLFTWSDHIDTSIVSWLFLRADLKSILHAFVSLLFNLKILKAFEFSSASRERSFCVEKGCFLKGLWDIETTGNLPLDIEV